MVILWHVFFYTFTQMVDLIIQMFRVFYNFVRVPFFNFRKIKQFLLWPYLTFHLIRLTMLSCFYLSWFSYWCFDNRGILNTEVYLESDQISAMELFCENSYENENFLFWCSWKFSGFCWIIVNLPSHYMWHNWKSCLRGRKNWALMVLLVFCVLDARE